VTPWDPSCLPQASKPAWKPCLQGIPYTYSTLMTARRLLWADGRGILPHGVRHLGGGPPRGREGRGEGDFCPIHRHAPSQRQPIGSWCPAAEPQRATGPLGGPAAGGTNDGVNGSTGTVVGRTSAHPRLHVGGQPAVVSRGHWKPRRWHTAGLLTSLHRALVLRLLT